MQVLKQAYQAEVLLREVQLVTVGTRYPFKDQVIITSENIYRHPDNDFFTYAQRIDVVIPAENRIEAVKLSLALREYFKKEKMLPLNVGVFQKPYLRDNQKARKYFSYSIDNAKSILSLLPEYQKDKKYDYAPGATQVESNIITNGYDLTYQIQNFTMEHLFMDTDFEGRPLDKPFYRLSLYTTSIFEKEDPKTKELLENEEIVLFHIKGDSESEILALAKKMNELQVKKQIINVKGSFPRPEKDYYSVNLSKSASSLLEKLNKDFK